MANIVNKKRNHGLSDLVGKKVKSISLEEVNVLGDGANVRQFYRILCSDGNELILACDGGSDDNQYATAEIWDPDDYESFLDEIREEQDSDFDADDDDSDGEDDDEEFDDDDDDDAVDDEELDI